MNCKKKLVFALILAAVLCVGCSETPAPYDGGPADSTDEAAVMSGDARTVTLTKSLTITEAGTYTLTGSIADGQLTVDAGKSDKIELIFDGVDISCKSSAALYIKSADKVTITLAEGSVNRLSSTGVFEVIDENNIDAALFSKEDLEIGGNGALTVRSVLGNGITSKDDLKIEGGVFEIDAGNHALEAKDALEIEAGEFILRAGKDGIHAENSDDSTLGGITISGGTVKIESDADGIDASADITISGGSITLDAGQKGIAASGNLTVTGGEFVLTASDDAVHANADIRIDGGDFTLTSGDDGIHADNNVTIRAGKINITKSYEGIEGHTVDITGGEITLISGDDGINAAGGNDQSGFGGGFGRGDMFASDANAYIRIKGGVLTMNANGDGIDSNGALYVDGGEIYLSGPQSGGNGALDYGTEAVVTGGIVFASGAAGMASNFTSASTQCAVMLSLNGGAGVTAVLKTAGGTVLAQFTPEKNYQTLVISHPELKIGESYILALGETEQSFTVSATITGSGGGFGGGFGGGRFPQGGEFPQGQMPQGQMPQGGRIPQSGGFPQDGGFGGGRFPQGQMPQGGFGGGPRM